MNHNKGSGGGGKQPTNPPTPKHVPNDEANEEQQLKELIHQLFGSEVTMLKKELSDLRARDDKLMDIVTQQKKIIKEHQITIQMYEKQRVKNAIHRSMECKAVQTNITGLPERELPSSSSDGGIDNISGSHSYSDKKPVIQDYNQSKRQRLAQNLILKNAKKALLSINIKPEPADDNEAASESASFDDAFSGIDIDSMDINVQPLDQTDVNSGHPFSSTHVVPERQPPPKPPVHEAIFSTRTNDAATTVYPPLIKQELSESTSIPMLTTSSNRKSWSQSFQSSSFTGGGDVASRQQPYSRSDPACDAVLVRDIHPDTLALIQAGLRNIKREQP